MQEKEAVRKYVIHKAGINTMQKNSRESGRRMKAWAQPGQLKDLARSHLKMWKRACSAAQCKDPGFKSQYRGWGCLKRQRKRLERGKLYGVVRQNLWKGHPFRKQGHWRKWGREPHMLEGKGYSKSPDRVNSRGTRPETSLGLRLNNKGYRSEVGEARFLREKQGGAGSFRLL